MVALSPSSVDPAKPSAKRHTEAEDIDAVLAYNTGALRSGTVRWVLRDFGEENRDTNNLRIAMMPVCGCRQGRELCD